MTNVNYTPLKVAASDGDLQTLVVLIDAGADVNEPFDFYSVLNCAVAGGHEDVVDHLLRSGADVNAENTHGWTALMFAAFFSRSKMVKALLMAGSDPNRQTTYTLKTALIFAAEKNTHPEIIRLMLSNEGTKMDLIDKYGWTALMHVCSDTGDDVKSVTALLDRGAYARVTNRYGWTPLMKAATADNPNIVDALIKHGVELDQQTSWGDTALMMASHDASHEIVKKLLVAGASVNDTKVTSNALVMACKAAHKQGATEVIKHLLEHASDVDGVDQYGNTPLMMVCENEAHLTKHPRSFSGSRTQYRLQAKLLVAYGSDTHAKDRKGVSIVDIATDAMQEVLNEPLFHAFHLTSLLVKRPDCSYEHRLMDQMKDVLPRISRMTTTKIPKSLG